jgi:hypothetical protein
MGVRSLIRTGVGRRPLSNNKPPAGKYRRRMKWELAGSQKGKLFAQRAQAETVMSMLKRNLGDALRARTRRARKSEHAFKQWFTTSCSCNVDREGRDRALPTPHPSPTRYPRLGGGIADARSAEEKAVE